MDEAKKYIAAARDYGIAVTEVAAEDRDHGFGMQYYWPELLDYLKKIDRFK